MSSLARLCIFGLARLGLVFAALLFLPAWTVNYWQAWLYFAIFMTCSIGATIYLWKYDRALLVRRSKSGPAAETRPAQKWIMRLAWFCFIGNIVLPSLDHRFKWSIVSAAIAIIANAIALFGWAIVFLAMRENSFAASTIEIASEQRVISTGPYAIIRHPMYFGGIILLVATPLALGSWWGLCFAAPILIVILWRLLDEEKFLLINLPGYAEYCRNVPSRLIPLIW